MNEPVDEHEAIQQLKCGNIAGLELLVRHYYTPAVRVALLVTHERAQAEDVVQEAFLRVYERIAQFDSTRPFGPWFLRSVVNDAIKQASRAARQRPLQNDADAALESHDTTPIDPAPGPEALLEQAETVAEVHAVLARLPPAQRAVLVQRYLLDCGEADIARALALPVGTVKSRLHGARRRLRALLRDGRAE